MSRNTRSCAGSIGRALIAVAAAVVVAGVRASPFAPPLPPAVTAIVPDVTMRGGGEFTYFGLAIYDGWYWAGHDGWPNGAYALDLRYRRDVEGPRIAERSVDEIARHGYGTPEQRARWRLRMLELFPDVRRGDHLTGVHRGGIVRFFHNGRALGEIAEPGFAQAFFGIWLDPRTAHAGFRAKLLGVP